MERKKLGSFGEDIAVDYLRREGYDILERNFSCRLGEVDVIAGKGDEIAFVEVKTRSQDDFGRPAEAVDGKKQAKIRKAATVFMLGNGGDEKQMRFDVMEIYCKHIESAF